MYGLKKIALMGASMLGAISRGMGMTGDLVGLDPGRIYGPRVYTRKNIGKERPWTARSCYTPHQGQREIARRKRQIDAGQLQITGESDAMRSARLAMTAIERVKDVA